VATLLLVGVKVTTLHGIAGLWSSWKDPKNGLVFSFTMLTINADNHPLMNQFHKPSDEKRMVAILPPNRYQNWIEGSGAIEHFMVPLSADLLRARADEPQPRKASSKTSNLPLFG